MAWVSKFSGLPANTDAPTGSDAYASGTGVFTIDTFTGSDRKFNDPPSSQSPIAYETLASMGASISAVLRVTTRWVTPFPPNGEVLTCGLGPVLYEAANRLDAIVAYFEDDNSGSGVEFAEAYENSTGGVLLGGVPSGYGPGKFIPFQARLYWNGTGSAFIIPDAGFGSWSVAANTVSAWHSFDDGATWVRFGDRAIAGTIAPDRVGAFVTALGVIPIGGTDTFTLGTLEVMEESAAGPGLELSSPALGFDGADSQWSEEALEPSPAGALGLDVPNLQGREEEINVQAGKVVEQAPEGGW